MEIAQSRNIGWDKIFALAALDAGIIVSWTAYHNFQPKLLEHFHFEHLSRFVQIAQSIVMLLVPLLAGWATDYYRKKTGSGFSVFAVGISVASLVFMTVSFTISDQAFVSLVWLLPTLIVFWLISMNIFHSPANSILEAFTKSPELPLMMSVLVSAKFLFTALNFAVGIIRSCRRRLHIFTRWIDAGRHWVLVCPKHAQHDHSSYRR